jgi:hypothetical protein
MHPVRIVGEMSGLIQALTDLEAIAEPGSLMIRRRSIASIAQMKGRIWCDAARSPMSRNSGAACAALACRDAHHCQTEAVPPEASLLQATGAMDQGVMLVADVAVPDGARTGSRSPPRRPWRCRSTDFTSVPRQGAAQALATQGQTQLADAEQAERMKASWRERLAAQHPIASRP